MTPTPAPTVLRFGDVLIVTGQSAVDAHLVFELGMRAARGDGINAARLGPLRAEFAATAAEVRARAGVRADVRATPDPPLSDLTEPLTSQEVAQMLHITPRHARRLAATLEARRLRTGVWVFDRYTVEAYIAGREQVAA